MSEVVYFFCAAASALCAFLLIRGYLRRRTRMLLWSSVYFLCQALSNAVLVLDLVIFPDVPLTMLRRLLTFSGTAIFLLAMIAEVDA